MSRKRTGTWASAVVVAGIAVVALAAGGSLDTGFGTGGVLTLATNGGMSRDVAVQADGRVLACGFESTGLLNELGQNINEGQVRRFSASGALDAGFGTGGIVRLFSDWGGDARDIAFDAGGRTIVGGRSSVRVVTTTVTGTGKKQKTVTTYSYPEYATLARLNSGGSLDTTFGTGGIVRTTVPGQTLMSEVDEVMTQPDGRIVVAGVAMFLESGVTRGRPFVARYLTNGALDASFGTGGITIDTAYSGTASSSMRGAALQSTGHVVLGVTRLPNLWSVIRFTPSGTVDTAFTASATTDEITNLAVDRFDRIVATGKTPTVSGGYDARVARYLPDGSADASFGTGGVVTINAYVQDRAYHAAFQADDSIVIAYQFLSAASRFVSTTVRLTDAGAIDTTYGSSGFGASLDLGSATTSTLGNRARLAPDGGILLGGNVGSTWFVARFASN